MVIGYECNWIEGKGCGHGKYFIKNKNECYEVKFLDGKIQDLKQTF